MHKGHYKGAKNVHHEELINEDSNCFQKSYILQNSKNAIPLAAQYICMCVVNSLFKNV